MKGRVRSVDDNRVDLKLQSELLRIAGFETSTAVDAESARALLRIRATDLILMDMAMPGWTGSPPRAASSRTLGCVTCPRSR
jgi:CheY-like chemotaxis protein